MTAQRKGRPTVKDPRVPYMTVRLNPNERKMIADAAAPYPPATWARIQLVQAAEAVLKERSKKGGKQ